MKEIINISIPKSRFKQKIKQANGTKYSHRVILPKEAGAYKYHVLLISEDFVQEDIDNIDNNVLHFYADREIQLSQHHRTPNGEDVYEKIRVMPKELYKSFYGEYKDNSRKRFTNEEVEYLKKNISVMDFLQDRAGFSFQRQGQHYYRCDQHSSLVIDTRNNAMFWNTEHINGSALEYLRKAEGKTFPEAMNILIEYHNGLAPDKKQYIAPKYEQIEFKLPDSQQNISKIYEYL